MEVSLWNECFGSRKNAGQLWLEFYNGFSLVVSLLASQFYSNFFAAVSVMSAFTVVRNSVNMKLVGKVLLYFMRVCCGWLYERFRFC